MVATDVATDAVGRVVTAMVTPFTDDGGLDLPGAERLADHLVRNGTETIVVHGTTGESPTLSADEAFEVLAAVKSAVDGRATIMMGTGSNSTATAVASTQRAAAAGADAVLVVTPYYNKPDQRGIAHYFRTVAASADVPVVLYDIPGRTAREIALETLLDLATVDSIIGVKDAVGDLQKAAEVVANTPDDFHVWSGSDELNLPFLSIGARGYVSVATHLAGNELREMVDVFPTDPAKARAIHHALLPLCRALFVEPNPAPLKGAMRRLGLPSGPVRGPLLDATDATVDAVLDALTHAGVDTDGLG